MVSSARTGYVVAAELKAVDTAVHPEVVRQSLRRESGRPPRMSWSISTFFRVHAAYVASRRLTRRRSRSHSTLIDSLFLGYYFAD